ncbi:MAG TPA: ABC transporter ATP-binding protein [Actinophytocola sp.]|uniref:ABC transporter ATP-binding protein n=1 Tax=Actinophytocola sp. TaxID=1872138 RepID=UPI002DDD1D4D|nr:ABC transporter ATP-binding protein [Actinophytocola sp.]HEV2784372.1 ABC transporter ATP-binding protein [Actinophytocola sp.]
MFLEVTDLAAGYAGSTVIRDVSFGLERGTTLGLLGRNGVGKSTLIMTLMGLVPPGAGSITLDGAPLAGRRPDQIARAGVALVPQGRRIWPPLTVREHLALAARRLPDRPVWTIERIRELLPRLGERWRHPAGRLSGGEQQMLAIARALLTNPTLMLMDEPSEGLAPSIVEQVAATIHTMAAEGVAVLLVEQDLHLAFEVCDEIAVLGRGTIVHRAGTEDFRRDEATAHRLLGV